jgi:VanZ family protein
MMPEGAESGAPTVPSSDQTPSRADRMALAWLPALLYTSTIWWLSSGPVDIEGIEFFPLQDKGIHFVEYGGLSLSVSFAVYRTWPGRGIRAALSAILITASLGLLDEFHQAFVPTRSADLLDLVADALGATFFALSYHALVTWRARRRARVLSPP